ncbi:MAG: L,D-transpeptidase [Cyanobacteria bacterium P01_F01_bin.153]
MKLKALKKKVLSLTTLLILMGGGAAYFLLARAGLLMPITELPSVVWLAFFPSEQAFHPRLDELNNEALLNRDTPLRQLLKEDAAKGDVTILVEKSKYRLTIFRDRQPIKSYPVVFGGSPEGDKLREGDQKTPEGVYFVRDLYPHVGWSKFIWLDYPRPESWREHFQAKFSGQLAWHAPIGGEIGIHGVPQGSESDIENRSNWTLGCVSLTNNDVDEIYEFIGSGTLIEIVA